MTVALLALAASSRAASLNRRLITVATTIARSQGATVELAEFGEFEMPLFDVDRQVREGMPAGAEALRQRLEAVSGVILASPEYNHSIPGPLKNALDWVSRFRPVPLRGKSMLLLSTSPGLVGGNRGLWALRVPLEHLGVYVHPEMFSLSQGDRVLPAAGSLSDPAARERLEKLVVGFLRFATALQGGAPV